MKMLGIVLVILFAHTINGQMSLSCNFTIQADFPECIQAFLGAGNVTEGETIDLLCANSQCQTAIASFVNSCNTADQEMLSDLQAVVTFGCIPVADDSVCFDTVAGFQDGYGDVSLTLINVTSLCFQEYITGTCSQYCLQLTDCEIATIELFGPNDNCFNAFSVLPNNTVDRISFDMANVALNTLCDTIGCRSCISNFTNRCLVSS